MAIRTDFTAGEVLAAADLNDTFAAKANNPNTIDTKTANYTLALTDRDKVVQMNSTSARTITIPTDATSDFSIGSRVMVANINTGTLTIAAASGATVNTAGALTLARWEGATLVKRAANLWVMLPFSSGVGNADFSDAATGTYTDGGINYKYKTYTGSGSVTITRAGLCDVLVIGGGGAGGYRSDGAGVSMGGGGAGGLVSASVFLPAGSQTITVGAGASYLATVRNGTDSSIGPITAVGGGASPSTISGADFFAAKGGSGGGGSGSTGNLNTASGGTPNQGFNGGNGQNSTFGSTIGAGGGGGAGAAGAVGTTSVGGAGGAGVSSSITGTAVTRAGGGGGARSAGSPGAGGAGGGGAGGTTTGTNGTANTGGGGGGAVGSSAAGNGGSGVVIIRVRTN
jgi:hypothetical protein